MQIQQLQLLYHNELEVGQVVNVYTDYHNETPSTYEGAAVLVAKHSDLHSFSLYNEKLLTREEDRAIDPKTGKHIPLTREQKRNNKTWERILLFFEHEPTKEIKQIRDRLKRKLSRDNKSLVGFLHVLRELRFKYMSDLSRIGFFFELYDDYTILRFFQQKYMRNWSPTIYREEKWLVEFIPEQYSITNQMCMYNSAFRTYRKLRTIACVCPSEDIQYCEIHKHFTGNDVISNDDRRIKRLKLVTELDDDEPDTDYDDADDFSDSSDSSDNYDSDDEFDEDISDEPDTSGRYAPISFEDSNISDYDRTLESGDDDYY